MKGQGPWKEFRETWTGEDDPWEAFEKDRPVEAAVILEAVKAWNAHPPRPAFLDGANLFRAHLTGAFLEGARLEGAWLAGANLEGANLEKAHLDGARLAGVQLEKAKLYGVLLGGADLKKAILRDTDMAACDLKATNLSNADLTDVIGLTSGQLAGADVTSAKLPEDIKDFESLKVTDEAAKNSRSLFLVMLLACVYSWLTLATTTDQALIMDTGSSLLPIIRVPVPIRGFFFAAPVFLLGAYAYFHLYLHGLWERLAELPAVFPDGRPLDRRAYPWLLTGLVRPHFERLKNRRALFSKSKVGLAILLAWWVVPFTIYLFWAQALAAHVWYMTALHLALFILSLGVGVITYRGAIATLRLEDPPATRPWDAVRQVVVAGSGRIAIGTSVLVLSSALALWGRHELPSVPVVFHPYADLTDAQLSTRTRALVGDSVEIVPAALAGRNLRFATLWRANLEEAALRGTDLSGAFLRQANLIEADLTLADLSEVDLLAANLRGANLSGTDLSGAYLSAGILAFPFSIIDGIEADVTGTNLRGADLTGVTGTLAFWLRAARAGARCKDPDTGELTEFEAPTRRSEIDPDTGDLKVFGPTVPDICVR